MMDIRSGRRESQDEKSIYATQDSERQPILLTSRYDGTGRNMMKTREPKASRRFRITLFWIFILCIGLTFWTWKWYLRPQMEEEREIREGFMTQNTNEDFDVAKKKHFDGVRMQELDPALVPGGEADPEGKRRLIFVGDIHGCAIELKALLEKVNFQEETDHLIAVGDIISKGPENVQVLDELSRINASSVRGNHEDRILALVPFVLESGDLPAEPEDDPSSERFAKDSALLRLLSPQHLQYLRDMPLMLRIPPLPLASEPSQKTKSPIAEEILVVHAGLVPAVSLEKQDPYFVMNMRSIHTKTHAPMAEAESKKAKTKAWHDIWNWYNERLFKHKSLKDFSVMDELSVSESEAVDDVDALSKAGKYPKPQVVVYGHRSKEGLQIERWTKGLDTGCVKGEKLTALVLDARGESDIVQVKCKDYR